MNETRIAYETGFQESLGRLKTFMEEFDHEEGITSCERSAYAFILDQLEKSRVREDRRGT